MNNSSFLPEDYLAKRTERRTNIICLSLFAIVMAAVFGAFLVTNQAWSQIKEEQEFINVRYTEAGQQIRELAELERQRDEMLHRAELAAALVERVPRSILLAELINRMPPQLGLLEFRLSSQVIQPARDQEEATRQGNQRGRPPARRPPTKEEAEESLDRIEPPRFAVTLQMLGVAPTDLEVTRYLSELNSYPLLTGVTLQSIEQKELDGRMVRQFRVSMTLASNADVRHINPLHVPRSGLRDPMNHTSLFIKPSSEERATVPNANEGGR
jgi:Tfp pilus assembly protein PilN